MIQKSKEQLERDDKIYQLTTLVAGEFSLQEVLDKLAEAAVKVTSVKACSIRLLDEQAADLEKPQGTETTSEAVDEKGATGGMKDLARAFKQIENVVGIVITDRDGIVLIDELESGNSQKEGAIAVFVGNAASALVYAS